MKENGSTSFLFRESDVRSNVSPRILGAGVKDDTTSRKSVMQATAPFDPGIFCCCF
jgi:hypothetical protein